MALAWCLASPADAAKSAGSVVVLDDAFTVAASTQAAGGGATVAGAVSPAATARLASIRGETAHGGFFAFPFPFARLLLLAPGESPVDGAFPGKAGTPEARILGSTFSVTVLATDWFYQPVADVPPEAVALSTTAGVAAVLPPQQTLVDGTTSFAGLKVVAATGTLVLTALDRSSAAIASSASSLTIVLPASSSPTVHLEVAPAGVYATLGGGIAGTASDPTGVQRVQLALRRLGSGAYYDQPARSFTLGAPAFFDASLGARAAASTTWFFTLPDEDLADGGSYEVQLVAENPSGLRVPAVSTFTFDPRGLVFAKDGGKASASAEPASAPGCEALTATVTVTLGGSGIQPGGGVALRLPGGWSRPASLVGEGELSLPGDVAVVSTAAPFAVPGSTVVTLNPGAVAGAPLGEGWVLIAVSTAASAGIRPGEEVAVAVRARPPLGPQGRGRQAFEVRTLGVSTGTLSSIAAPPSIELTTGTRVSLAFRDAAPLALGPLQTSPTLQIETVDACGNPAPPPAALTATLEVGSIDPGGSFVPDPGAVFFAEQTGAAIAERLIFPPETRPFAPGGFYYRTSSAGPLAQYVRLGGSFVVGESYRYASLRPSPVAVSSASVDTGVLSPGTTSAVLAPGGSATVRFAVEDPEVGWEVRIATAAGAQPLFAASGSGAPRLQAVSWNGLDERSSPPRAAPPGRYGVFIRAGGGTVEDRTLELRVPASSFVFGSLGPAGAGAFISADGPGAPAGRYSVASSSGYFEVYGLAAGERYGVKATTRSVVLGQPVELSTSVAGVLASAAGGQAAGLGFAAPSAFRLSVALPAPAPYELVGRALARTADYGVQAFGSLHFAEGGATSDSGGQAFGTSAGTWTVVGLPPGAYDVEVEVPQVGVSMVLGGRELAPGQVQDLKLAFTRKASVHGYAVVPATKAFGTWVSVQATREGDRVPSAFGGGFVAGDPAPRSSAPYSLFGLDPGTWTLTARAQGFVSTSAAVVVSTADVGDPVTFSGGVDLALGLGGVLVGSVTVLGDTSGLPAACSSPLAGACEGPGFALFVQAYDPKSFASVSTPVRLSTSASGASAGFTLTGLSSGRHLLRAFLPGFQLAPAGGVAVEVSTPAAAAASLTLRPNDGRFRLDLTLGGGGGCLAPSAFERTGFFMDLRPDAAPVAGGDLTSLAPTLLGPGLRADLDSGTTVRLHCSSMTLLSPALGPGLKRVWVTGSPVGAARFLTVPLAQGATAVASADLTTAVYTVTGTVSVSGTLSLGGADGSAVLVSSAAGLAVNAPAAEYCLLSSSAPVRLSAARVELVPLAADGSSPGPLLEARAAGGDCRAFTVPGGLLANGLPDPAFKPPALVAYPGEILPDGSFRIESVPPGAYLLRNVPDLDLDASDGLEAAEFRAVVQVSTGGTLGTVPIGAGFTVRGRVLAPPGTALTRPVRVSLSPIEAGGERHAELAFAGSGAVEFAFPRVAPGRYWVKVVDQAFPRAYAAAPKLVEAAAGDVSGVELRLVPGGGIRARLAVESVREDGTREQLLVSASNPELLPSGLRVHAVANPWFQGGFFTARGRNCGGVDCRDVALDSSGQVAIDAVLPGTYDVELAAGGADALSLGGAPVASRVVAGVTVGEGETIELGTLRLGASAVLTGRAIDAATGLPVPNARIRAAPAAGRPGDRSRRREPPEAFTGADGRYELSGLDPEVRYYDVVAAARVRTSFGDPVPAYEPRLAASVDLKSTGTLDFSLLPAPFTLAGRVVAASGRPLSVAVGDRERPGALVYLQKANEVPVFNPLADNETLTDPEGRFAVPGLATGTYRLIVVAAGRAALDRTVVLSSASIDVGTLALAGGASLAGRILKPDGTAPGEDEVEGVVALTSDLTEFLPGGLIRDEALHAVTGYRLSGFKLGRAYRVLLVTARGERIAPEEAASLVFASTAEARALDLVLRPPAPRVHATARREGSGFRVRFELSHPLRARTAADDDLEAFVATVSARGTLSEHELSADRGLLSVFYAPGFLQPGVLESSFTLRLSGRSAQRDPASADRLEPEFVVSATATFHVGVDGHRRVGVNNFQGGVVALEGDAGRLRLPKGAFAVDASSTVELTLRRSLEALAVSGRRTAQANLSVLRYRPSAYPAPLVAALAATPPELTPFGPSYDVSLPLGLRVAKPVELCVAFSGGAAPERLNLYWYNEAANVYVLQQDVRGEPPRIDPVNRTRCQYVDHFSTFVLFDTGVSVITGSGYSGSLLEAFAFPNPFDLSVKQVTPIHGLAAQSIRGTMLRVGVPAAVSGAGRVRVYDVAGARVRTLELGQINGGAYYYQPWDGRDDSGRDVASGVYVAEVEIGGQRTFFKMAVLK